MKNENGTAIMETIKFREALQKVNYIPRNRTLPSLSNALVEFGAGIAVLSTSDLERVIKIEIDSNNSEVFSTLLPRRQIERFLKGDNGKTELVKKGNTVSLSRPGIGSLNCNVSPVSDFPPVLKSDNLDWHTIDGKWFCRMLNIVKTSCAHKETRPVLIGVACKEGEMAAADGFRLSVLKDSRLTFGLGDKQIIIPFDTVQLLTRLFAKEEKLEIAWELGMMRGWFKAGNVTLISQTIQGNFPDYNQLIPKQFVCKATFSVPAMMQRLEMIDEKDTNITRFTITTLDKGEQVCKIQAGENSDFGAYLLSCPVKYDGEAAKIAFNLLYVKEAIKPFSVCNMELTSLSSPGKFTGDIEGLTIVVMPMFVHW